MDTTDEKLGCVLRWEGTPESEREAVLEKMRSIQREWADATEYRRQRGIKADAWASAIFVLEALKGVPK